MDHGLLDKLEAYIQAGGGVMVVLIGLTLVMWTLALIKAIRFVRERRRESSVEKCLEHVFGRGAGRAAEPADWQMDILAAYLRERSGDPVADRELLASLRSRQEARAGRHITTILVLAAAAPLLGLLGTVGGMITTFDVISQFGPGNARALASGVSEALVTTQGGLAAAAPGLLLGTMLLRSSDKLGSRMELFCLDVQRCKDVPAERGG